MVLLKPTLGDIEVRGKGTLMVVALKPVDNVLIIHPDQSIV
jgi:hypothetical protein